MISDIWQQSLVSKCGQRTFPRELELSFAHIYGKRCRSCPVRETADGSATVGGRGNEGPVIAWAGPQLSGDSPAAAGARRW